MNNQPQTLCIMRIDNEPDEHMILSIVLDELGIEYDKINFDSAEDAIEYLQTAVALPDYIIVDYVLPGRSGIEFTKQLKEADHLREIPVILYSAHLSISDFAEAKAAGINHFIERFPNTALIKQQILCFSPFI